MLDSMRLQYLMVIPVEVACLIEEDLDILNEFALESWLDLDQMGRDLRGLRLQLLPRVPQGVHSFRLLLSHWEVVLVQHGVRFL